MFETWTYEVNIIYNILETLFYLFFGVTIYAWKTTIFDRSVVCQRMLSNTLGILTHEIEDWNRNTWDIPYVGAFENFGFTPDQGSWSSGIDDKALELWFPYFQTKQHH